MIYLIDEKLNRQQSYGWDMNRFEKYAEKITLISDFKMLQEVTSKKLLEKSENVIMIHNSFFKNLNVEEKELFDFKNRIRTNQIKLVIFGGSFNKTSANNRELEMPVSAFYKNLDLYLNHENDDLLILAYGKNAEKEKWLVIKNKVANFLFAFDNNYMLSDNEVFEIQQMSEFNDRIINILDESRKIADIKTLLNS